jgi:ribosomal 50S subunit-recycling heat shock protein
MNLGTSMGGDGAANEEAIARLLVSGNLLRRRRFRRLLLARLLNEAREPGEEEEFEGFEGEEGGPTSEHRLAKFLIASGILQRRRVRRMVLAHLLRERGGGGEEYEPEFEEYGEGEEAGPTSEHRLAKFLIASGILRRRRIRRMVLAHLLRERGGREAFEPEFEEYGEGEEMGGPTSDHRLAKFLIASGILRRRRIRRMVMAHLLREHGEGFEPESEGFEAGEEGGGDRRLAKFLIASGLLRRRRLRRTLLAHLLRERGGEFGGFGEFGGEGAEMEGEEYEGEEPGWGGGFFGSQRTGRRFERAYA